jgi:hypothetical protein
MILLQFDGVPYKESWVNKSQATVDYRAGHHYLAGAAAVGNKVIFVGSIKQV